MIIFNIYKQVRVIIFARLKISARNGSELHVLFPTFEYVNTLEYNLTLNGFSVLLSVFIICFLCKLFICISLFLTIFCNK